MTYDPYLNAPKAHPVISIDLEADDDFESIFEEISGVMGAKGIGLVSMTWVMEADDA